MSFKDFGLLDELVRGIADKGYTQPTRIQQQSIPVILKGGDILAGSQTGSGKTASFVLPLLQRLMSGGRSHAVRALILAPTRELAAQIGENVKRYGKYLPLRSTVIFGGVNINPQARSLQKGVDIVIATPGRLLDHVGQKTVDLSKIEMLVLDEADHMLDMGFIRDIRRILSLLPKKRQNLLFSATFSDEIRALAADLLNSPTIIEAAPRNTPAPLISQIVYPVDNKKKRSLLTHLVLSGNWKQVLVFTRTKHAANKLAEHLAADGISATAIHGNKTQGARTKALADFKRGSVRVLVATDIVARGLDINELPRVVNFELPDVPENYVHRIGRTGRVDKTGEAISLVCVDELKLLRDIERLLKTKIESAVIPGYEVDPTIKPEPIFDRRQGPFNRKPDSSRRHAPPRRR